MNNSPIGIFDSGIGGITIFNSVKKLLPNEDVRNYTLRFLSSCLSGEVREEKFYF